MSSAARSQRLRRAARGVGMRVGWLFVATAIALGGAGIVTAMNRGAGTPARAELTWTGDAAARPALLAAEDSLRALEAEVATLGSFGRLALAELAANDAEGIDAAIADGTAHLARVDAALAAFRDALESVPAIGDVEEGFRLSQDLRDRYDLLVVTIRETDDLAIDWRAFTQGTLDAHRITSLLDEHARAAADAVLAGSRARYEEALAQLDVADARLAAASELRDTLAERVDVATLDRWLERNARYDAALRELYGALVESAGRVTTRVREAASTEREAREQLPEDTRAIVVIMSEVARGGLNQAVISIEETRAALAAALGALASLDATTAPAAPAIP